MKAWRFKKRFSRCIWANVLTSWVPIVLVTSGIVSSKAAADALVVVLGVGTVVLTLVFSFFLWKWCRLSRSYGLLLTIPLTLVPFFGTIGFVVAYNDVATHASGHHPDAVPTLAPIRQCRCGGTMFAVEGTQVNAPGRHAAGYALRFECANCGRKIAVSSWLLVVHEVFGAMFLGVLALVAAVKVWNDEGSFKHWAVLSLAGMGFVWIVWKFVRGAWNRLRYRVWKPGVDGDYWMRMMTHPQHRREAQIIRKALMQDWDPYKIANHPNPKLADEYESFHGTVHRILSGSRSEDELTDFFYGVEVETRGPGARTREELRKIARKFLTLDVQRR